MNNDQTTAFLMETILAQSELMNGKSQFSTSENKKAIKTLERLVEEQHKQGNHRLEQIYRDLLLNLRRPRT